MSTIRTIFNKVNNEIIEIYESSSRKNALFARPLRLLSYLKENSCDYLMFYETTLYDITFRKHRQRVHANDIRLFLTLRFNVKFEIRYVFSSDNLVRVKEKKKGKEREREETTVEATVRTESGKETKEIPSSSLYHKSRQTCPCICR